MMITQEQKKELETLKERLVDLEQQGDVVGYIKDYTFVDFSYIKEEFEKDTKEFNATDDEIWAWHTRQESNTYSENFLDFGLLQSHLDDVLDDKETIAECNYEIELYKLLQYFNLNTELFEEIYG